MNFYGLRSGTGDEVGNVFPQLEGLEPSYDRLAPNAQRYLRYDYFPAFEPVFSKKGFRLGAKVTDILSDAGSIGGVGLFSNEKLKVILEDFITPPSKFYKQELFKEGVEIEGNYYWMQVLVIDGLVDFEKSDLFLTKSFGRFVRDLEIKSQEEFEIVMKEKKNLEYVDYRKLVFSKKYMEFSFDIFYLLGLSMYVDFIISERLKDRLEEEKVTGLAPFKKLNIFLP